MVTNNRIQIVLDADVVIHFSKGGMLSLLPNIFPEYEYVILEIVHDELKDNIRTQIDQQVHFLKSITMLPFEPRGEMLREYANLLKMNLGRGESACMAYCLFTQNVIGSSNLKDIREYCEKNKITYLTTLDFLWHAWNKKLITTDEANRFINEVRNKGSKLPNKEIEKYVCTKII